MPINMKRGNERRKHRIRHRRNSGHRRYGRQNGLTGSTSTLPSPSLTIAVLMASCSLADFVMVSAWTSESNIVARRMAVSARSNPRTSYATTTTTTTTRLWAKDDGKGENADEDLISEMDARVLQSMLRDNKLDLEQSENMKKLLERGVRKDKDFDDLKELRDKQKEEKKTEDEEDNAYSSQVIKTLANTKFWKAFKRNAGEALESLAISVTNEIEKGAKVLVGLGFFAWDRAKQDVARALPTAATGIPKKQVFQLGETSSFVEQTESEEDELKSRSQRAKSLRQEFTTPGDEFSAVTAEISSIFKKANREMALKEDKSKDMRNPFFAAFVEQQSSRSTNSADDSTPFYGSATLSSTASRGSARLEKAFKKSQKTKLAQQKENPASRANRLAAAAIDSAYQVQKEIQSEQNVPGYKTKELRESTVDVSRRIAGAAKKTAGFLGGASAFLLGVGGETEEGPKQLPSGAEGGKVKADPVDYLDDSAYFAFKREGGPRTDTDEEPMEDLASGIVIEDGSVTTQEPKQGGGAFGFLKAITKRTDEEPVDDLASGIVIEDGSVTTQEPKQDGGAFGFLKAFTKRGRPENDLEPQGAPTEVRASPSTQPEAELITAEVVMDNKDNFNYFDAETADSDNERFTTETYLDSMEAAATTPEVFTDGAPIDDGLRQVTAEVITDDEFDESVFEQATAVDNLSVEELLEQQAAEEAAEKQEPNFVTKATLRTLDVAFLVVEKGLSVAPGALEVANRAVTRATEAQLKDSAGSKVGWEFLNGNVRGEKRY